MTTPKLNYAGSATKKSPVSGQNAWSNESNIVGSNEATYADISLAKSLEGPLLIGYNYQFDFGTNALDIITNIKVSFKVDVPTPADNVSNKTIQLTKDSGSTFIGNNLANPGENLPASSVVSVSGNLSFWGVSASLDAADINGSGFGVGISFDGSKSGSGQTSALRVFYIAVEIEYEYANTMLQVYNGSSWVLGKLRRWNGSAWVPALKSNTKRWNGSAWVGLS